MAPIEKLHDTQAGRIALYFYSKPGALMLPMGGFATGRAFVPEEEGGQPHFPLGIMRLPR